MRNSERIPVFLVVVGVTAFVAGGETSEQVKSDTIEDWRQPAVKTDQPSSMTRKQLLAIVEANSRKIKDFEVTSETVLVKPNPNMVGRSQTTVVVKGSKTHIEENYSKDPNATAYEFRRTAAFNGKSKRSRETDTQGHRFFDLNLLNAPKESRGYNKKRSLIKRLDGFLARGGRGKDDQSLLALLRNSKSKVRPVLEKIGDRSCHVVDCGSLTVWLDVEHGCVPLRQIFHDERNPKQTVLVFLVRKVHEVAPGFWVATRGRKFNDLTPGASELTGTNEKIILVEGWESDKPVVSVNAGVPDRFFDLRENLPLGTSLWDKAPHYYSLLLILGSLVILGLIIRYGLSRVRKQKIGK